MTKQKKYFLLKAVVLLLATCFVMYNTGKLQIKITYVKNSNPRFVSGVTTSNVYNEKRIGENIRKSKKDRKNAPMRNPIAMVSLNYTGIKTGNIKQSQNKINDKNIFHGLRQTNDKNANELKGKDRKADYLRKMPYKNSSKNESLIKAQNKYASKDLVQMQIESNLMNTRGRESNISKPIFGRGNSISSSADSRLSTTISKESMASSNKSFELTTKYIPYLVSKDSAWANKKIILIFVKYWYTQILQKVDFRLCKVTNCVVTQDKSTIQQASAVIFNHLEIKGDPPPKLKEQIWIFHTEEPPFYTKTSFHRAWQGMFNFTMTYRHDSDFLDAFGRLERRKVPLRRDYDSIFNRKQAEVAMFESNCRAPSRRKDYVKMLMRYIKVDVFGLCGEFKCGESNFYSVGNCHEKISRQYKFYLVFENSICNDYTTEKFYGIFEKQFPIIPVVRGAQNILEYIPSKLFINTYDFRDPKDLATYLIQLGNDRVRYINFLRTMDDYVSPSHAQIFQESMCKLCSLLHGPIPLSKSVDILRWTWTKQCPLLKTAGEFEEKFRRKTN